MNNIQKVIFYLVELLNQCLELIVSFVLRTDMDAKTKRNQFDNDLQILEKIFTVKCWNNHARIIFVATFGKMPRFFWRFFELSSRSSSSPPVLSPPEPTLLSKLSPEKQTAKFSIESKVNSNAWRHDKRWNLMHLKHIHLSFLISFILTGNYDWLTGHMHICIYIYID